MFYCKKRLISKFEILAITLYPCLAHNGAERRMRGGSKAYITVFKI
jgi:hypothetical protein